MNKEKSLIAIPALITMLLITVASYYQVEMLWGLNHFTYFDHYALYVLAGISVFLLYAIIGRIPSSMINKTFDLTSGLLWGKSQIARILVSVGFGLIFFIFRVQTAFLGDGYFLLNIFGRNESYTSDFVKPLSILIIKTVQNIFGGYSYETALYAFQSISIISGMVVVYNLIVISGLLSESNRGRILNLGVLIGSGWLLLFFGYIEYYPLLWMVTTFFIKTSIEHIRGRQSIWLVLFLFLIAIGVHAQSIYFLPGIIYLLGLNFFPNKVKNISSKQIYVFSAIGILLVFVLIYFSANILSKGQNPFLPLVSGSQSFPLYGVLSFWNLLEVFNLLLLCIPSIFVLCSLLFYLKLTKSNSLSRLLTFYSLGSLTFLLTMNPILGLARDFDLMSLTLLCPLLLLLYKIGGKEQNISVRLVIVCIIITSMSTISFLMANISVNSSEERMFNLLKYYGNKEKGGWTSFAKYLERGNPKLHAQVVRETSRIYPDDQKFSTASSLFSSGKLTEAESLLRIILINDPANGNYLALLGAIKAKQGKISEGIELYLQTLKTQYNHNNLQNLGRLYLVSRDYPKAIKVLNEADRLSPNNEKVLTALCNALYLSGNINQAKKIADQLLQKVNQNSPDAYAFYLVFSVQKGDNIQAKKYYDLYLRYGSKHTDYDAIRKAYGYLSENN